ncbi:hypothetical protein [Streptomyces sp. NPDC054865]
MPQPVQLVEFDTAEREVLLEAGQPKAIDVAMRTVTARIKQQLKTVAELASTRSVGASPEQLADAATALQASLALLQLCPAGEVADLRALQQEALRLVGEGQQISAALPTPANPRPTTDPRQAQPSSDGDHGFDLPPAQ